MQAVGVIDRHARVGISDGRHVRYGAARAARIGLPAGLRDVCAAPAAGAAPDRFSPAACIGRPVQRRSAYGRHVLRRRRKLDAKAVVAGAHRDGDARMIEMRLRTDFAGVLAATIRIRDHGRTQQGCPVDGGGEIGKRVRGCFHEQDLAVGADGARHVEVERDLLGPSCVSPRICRAPVLVHLAEAAVGRGARRQPELVSVHGEVALGVAIIVGIDDGDGLPGAPGGGELVRGDEVDGVVPRWAARGERTAAAIDANERMTSCFARCGAWTDARVSQASGQAGATERCGFSGAGRGRKGAFWRARRQRGQRGKAQERAGMTHHDGHSPVKRNARPQWPDRITGAAASQQSSGTPSRRLFAPRCYREEIIGTRGGAPDHLAREHAGATAPCFV